MEPVGKPVMNLKWYLHTNMQVQEDEARALTRSSLYDLTFPAIQPPHGTA